MELLYILQLGFGFLLFWFLYSSLWKHFCVHRLRIGLYEHRHELTRYWKNNNLDFNAPAYTTIQSTLKFLLKKSGGETGIIWFLFSDFPPEVFHSDLKLQAKFLPKDARNLVRKTREEVQILLTKTMVECSPFLFFALYILVKSGKYAFKGIYEISKLFRRESSWTTKIPSPLSRLSSHLASLPRYTTLL